MSFIESTVATVGKNIPAILSAVGTGTEAYGQYQSGNDIQVASEYNAAVYEQKAQIIDVKQGLTRQAYERLRKQYAGKSVAAVAGSGYDYSGSFLEVINEGLTQIDLDKQIAIYNLEVEKFQAQSSAQQSLYQGMVASRSANTQASSTLLTQGNDWYQKYGGIFGGSEDGSESIGVPDVPLSPGAVEDWISSDQPYVYSDWAEWPTAETAYVYGDWNR